MCETNAGLSVIIEPADAPLDATRMSKSSETLVRLMESPLTGPIDGPELRRYYHPLRGKENDHDDSHHIRYSIAFVTVRPTWTG